MKNEEMVFKENQILTFELGVYFNKFLIEQNKEFFNLEAINKIS